MIKMTLPNHSRSGEYEYIIGVSGAASLRFQDCQNPVLTMVRTVYPGAEQGV